MSFLERVVLFLVLLPLSALAGESYKIETRIDGKPVTTYIQLFDESPFENPKLLEQIRGLELDHVAFLKEDEGLDRRPMAASDLDELKGQVESETQVPVVEIKQKKGFFARLGQLWNLSFKNPALKPGPADYRYGLVSTVGETALYSAMVFTSSDIPLENGIALVAVQTLLSYANNVWNNSINHFLSSSIKQLGKPTDDRTYFFRNLSYDYVTSQIFKLVQSARTLLTWKTQSTILMNSLMGGMGDVLTSNTSYKAFKGDKVKLARANFYVSAISTAFGSLDLMQHQSLPVLFSVGAYDFRLSGAILIGYYIGAIWTIKKFPEQLDAALLRFEAGLQTAKTWVQARVEDCRQIFSSPRKNGAAP